MQSRIAREKQMVIRHGTAILGLQARTANDKTVYHPIGGKGKRSIPSRVASTANLKAPNVANMEPSARLKAARPPTFPYQLIAILGLCLTLGRPRD